MAPHPFLNRRSLKRWKFRDDTVEDEFEGVSLAVNPGTTYSDHFSMLNNTNLANWIADTLSHANASADRTYTETPPSKPSKVLSATDQVTSPSQQIEYVEGTVAPGAQAKVIFPADGVATLRIVTASDCGGLRTTLRSPQGGVIDSTTPGTNPLVTYTTSGDPVTTAALAIYEIKQPASGNWTVVMDGLVSAKKSIGYSLEVHGDSYLTLIPLTGKTSTLGQEIPIACALQTLTASGVTSVTSATVRAIVTLPDATVTSLTLTDDGTRGDTIAQDGIYIGTLSGTSIPGEYQIFYRADGINPDNKSFFRRVRNGSSLNVSSGQGFIAGNIQTENVDRNGDGIIDYVRVQMVVDVATSGTYSVSGDLVDGVSGVRITASQTVTQPAPGASTISLFFDRHGLPTGMGAGPFRLENLRLYQTTGSQIKWLDEYQAPSEIQAALYGPPSSSQIVDYLLGKSSVPAGVFDLNGDGVIDISDLIFNLNDGK